MMDLMTDNDDYDDYGAVSCEPKKSAASEQARASFRGSRWDELH